MTSSCNYQFNFKTIKHDLKFSFLLRVNFRRDFQAQAVQADKAGGVVLIIRLRRIRLHRGNVRVIEAVHRLAAGDLDSALVELHPHGARDVLLALFYQGLQGEAFGSEPEAVIDQFGITRD